MIASSLAIRGLGATDPIKQTASRRTSVGRGHRVTEWVIEIAQPGTKPILVIVRIADVRPSTGGVEGNARRTQANEMASHATSPDSQSFHFDRSGLPLQDERR